MGINGLCDIEVEGKVYRINTAKPDFFMDYKENFTNRSHSPFCVLSETPVPMPNAKGEMGYLCVCVIAVRRWDHFPIYVVQKKVVRYKGADGSKRSRVEYIYAPLHNKYDKYQGKVIRRVA